MLKIRWSVVRGGSHQSASSTILVWSVGKCYGADEAVSVRQGSGYNIIRALHYLNVASQVHLYARMHISQPSVLFEKGSPAVLRHSAKCCRRYAPSLWDANHPFSPMFNHASPSLVHLIVFSVRLSEVFIRISKIVRLVTVNLHGPLPNASVNLA